jgi:hypothetical protein
MIDVPSGSISGTFRSTRVDDFDLKVSTFPTILPWPEDGEANDIFSREAFGQQVANIRT